MMGLAIKRTISTKSRPTPVVCSAQKAAVRHQKMVPLRRATSAVERCSGTRRYEFYETYDLPSGVDQLNPTLDSYQHLYNHHRPHGALAGITPAQYLARQSARTTNPSHMS